MSKLLGRALAIALLVCCWPAFWPAGGAHALGRPCADSEIHVAIVVDFGDALSTTSTCIAANSRNRGTDILAARAQALGKVAPRFDGSGLLCAIDGYPETGCGEKNGSTYAYWSYWHGNNGSWTYSSFGPSAWQVREDYVEGWRWQPNGAEGSVPPPRADPNVTATCVPAPPPTDAPTTVAPVTRPPDGPAVTNAAAPTTAARATRPATSTTVAPVGVSAPPLSAETTSPSTAPTSTTTGDDRETEDIAARSAAGDDDDGGGGSAPIGLILGVVLIAAIGGGAFFVQRKRASP